MGKKRFHNRSKSRRKASREDEAQWRLTYLHTASLLLAQNAPNVSRFYTQTSRQICRRVNLLTDSVSVKRLWCKCCNHSLLAGVGPKPARHRIIKQGGEKFLVITCGTCQTIRRLPLRPRCMEDELKKAEDQSEQTIEPSDKGENEQPKKKSRKKASTNKIEQKANTDSDPQQNSLSKDTADPKQRNCVVQ